MSEFRFGTVGAPISTPKKPGGSIGAINEIRNLNLDALELAWVHSVNISHSTCEAIRIAGEINNVSLSIHAPYYINLNSTAEEWIKSKKRLMDAAIYGNLAGATDIIFHPGTYFGLPPIEVLRVAIPRLNECREELRKLGTEVRLRPETMGKSAMLGSLEDTLRLSIEVQGIQPCLDFAHLHARAGDGTINSYVEWMEILKIYAEKLGETSLKQLHIHVSGIEYTAKGERNHLIFSESDLDINGLLKALKDFHCEGRILCESPILEKDALMLKQLWEDIN